MDAEKLRSGIQNLVAANDLDTALELLLKELKSDAKIYKMVINLSAKLSDLKQSLITGNVPFEKTQDQRNLIRSNILDILDFLDQSDLKSAKPETAAPAPKAAIPVFFSMATPFNSEQQIFIEAFEKKFETQGLNLVKARWSSENPLLPVREILKEVSGCVVLALERMKSTESIYKPGSPKQQTAHEEYFTTPWIQMEAAMAYQQELPILIFSEKKLKMEGMIEMGVHEFRVFKIDPSNPEELNEEYFEGLIENWSEKVKKNYHSRNA